MPKSAKRGEVVTNITNVLNKYIIANNCILLFMNCQLLILNCQLLINLYLCHTNSHKQTNQKLANQ